MAPEKLYATIFKGEGGVPRDDEAYGHWLSVGVPAERIFEMGMKDNFWAMGDTGPCGPCSELHYDMGVESSDKLLPECAAGECKFPCECGRYVEIWNLVFMQFVRDADGKLTPLPKPSIDTGAGLERVTAVLQGVVSNYDTDLFTPLIKRAAELTGASLAQGNGERGQVEERGVAAGDRRPCAGGDVPDLRRRRAGQRRTRLRAAQDHSPRHSPWPLARTERSRFSTRWFSPCATRCRRLIRS